MEVKIKVTIPKDSQNMEILSGSEVKSLNEYNVNAYGKYFAEKLMLIVADLATRSLETVNELQTFANDYDVYYETKGNTIILHVKLPDYVHVGSTFVDVLKYYEKVFQRMAQKWDSPDPYKGHRGGKK